MSSNVDEFFFLTFFFARLNCFFKSVLVAGLTFSYYASRECSIDIGEFRDGQRHDMWLPLENIKTGRMHVAVTVLEDNGKVSPTYS